MAVPGEHTAVTRVTGSCIEIRSCHSKVLDSSSCRSRYCPWTWLLLHDCQQTLFLPCFSFCRQSLCRPFIHSFVCPDRQFMPDTFIIIHSCHHSAVCHSHSPISSRRRGENSRTRSIQSRSLTAAASSRRRVLLDALSLRFISFLSQKLFSLLVPRVHTCTPTGGCVIYCQSSCDSDKRQGNEIINKVHCYH